jgi:hypothetical protein
MQSSVCDRVEKKPSTPPPVFHSLAFLLTEKKKSKVPNREDIPALGFPHLRLFDSNGGGGGHTHRYIERVLFFS